MKSKELFKPILNINREDCGEACAIIDDGEKFEKCAICGRENADEWRDELRGYICAECATL